MLTHHVKVIIKGKAALYLEKAKYITTQKGVVFLSGYQVDKQGDADKEILHLIELGTKGVEPYSLFTPGKGCPRVYAQAFNPTYCELEYAPTSTGRWQPGVTPKQARIH